MRVRKILALTLAMVLVLGSFTFGFGASTSPGLKTTDSTSSGVQINHFNTKQDVFIYGSNLVDGWYYVRVVAPGSGNTPDVNLGTSKTASLKVVNKEINPNPSRVWEHVQFEDSTNNGGVYKVIIATNEGFTENEVSTKTFKIGNAKLGSLTIQKDVLDIDDNTTFNVNISGPYDYSETVTISENSSITINDLYYGTYTLTEVNNNDYIIDGPETLVVDENNLVHTITFENTLKTYEMTIEKTVVTDRPYYPGEQINYEITVTNTGNQTLTDIDVTDEMIGLEETNLSLAPGATSDVFTGSYTAGADELGTLTNTATASSGDLSVESSVDVTIIDKNTEMYSVSLEVEPEGSGTTTGAGDYYENQTVTVTAAPNTGWEFVNWVSLTGEEPEEVNTDSSYTFTMPASDVALVANFEPESVVDEPSMTINKDVDDSSVYVNEEVTYTISVTNNGNVDLEYVWVTDELLDFEEMIDLLEVGETKTFTLTTSYSTTGERVNTAVAEYGIETEGYMSVEDSATVVVTDEEIVYYSVSTQVQPEGSGTTTGDGDYEEEDSVTVTATPTPGYTFINWTSLGGEVPEVVSTDPDYTFIMPASDVALVANFELESVVDEPSMTINKDVDDSSVYVNEE
ncbi:MAG: hypothetical protein SCJ93_11440, partial [Bacillota bacterium]|nr:hypothetical protein [Bacillota bacterium]